MNHVRKAAFFGLDVLRGGKVRAHLQDLAAFERLDPAQQDSLIAGRLESLLRHAAATTASYRSLEGVVDLYRFPVITKKELVANPDAFLSSAYRRNDLKTRTTSGSYGTPMKVFLSPEKFARQQAEVIDYNRRVGLDVGDRYINVTSTTKSFLERWMKNGVIINPSVMGAAWYASVLEVLKRNTQSVIVGFPSVLYPVAQYILSRGSEAIPMRGIISIAEPLPRDAVPVISRAFQCPVQNRYASLETGVLAHSRAGKESLFINRASYIVELLSPAGDRPAREGEEGRVIVTDLYSDAMPLIRYEIGDTAILRRGGRLGISCMDAVEGRIVEAIYDTKGLQVSWAIVYDILILTDHIIQYQFSQRADTVYHISLIVDSPWGQTLENAMRDKFIQVLGEEARIGFDYPEFIPPLPSGKRPMIMNLNRPR